uniref:Methyltransferase FkbM domain-containing protein n=1 Tax=viral metagenome TaxID=1070528 RepID=A0A6C0D152_9ZZZZ
MDTFNTKYGLISLLQNELYIRNEFIYRGYWDEDTLIKLKQYVDPNRNILEIGGHCGTSTIVYASYLNNDKKVYVYEPQQNMYNVLMHNISQNNLQDKIIPYNSAVFCYNGTGNMNNIDVDGDRGEVEKRYTVENTLPCNFGGISLGKVGENVNFTTVDNMNLENIGFIHCDAQGSENYIFSKAIDTITKNRPVIYYEDNRTHSKYLCDIVDDAYPQYKDISLFDVKQYCMEKLNYKTFIDKFNGSIDTLLIP